MDTPDTLPANFNFNTGSAPSAPDTLPANFNFGNAPVAQQPTQLDVASHANPQMRTDIFSKIFPGLTDLAQGGIAQWIKGVKSRPAPSPESLAMGFMGGGDLAVAGGLPEAVLGGAKSALEDISKIKGVAEKPFLPDQNPLELSSKITGAKTPVQQANDLTSLKALHDSGYLNYVTDTPGLQKAIDTKISDNLKAVDNAFQNSPDANLTINSNEMKQGLKHTGGTTDYIKTALQNLESQYTSSLQDSKLANVKGLLSKYSNEGLTAKEINDLSRQYGGEFSSKSFTKTGLPKAGVNADAAETVRSGLKDISRNLMPDKATELLDRQTSKLIDTKTRLDAQEKSVLNAQSNTPASSQAGRLLNKATNVLEKIPKSFTGGVKSLGAQGTADVLKMEQLIARHVSLLQKLLIK